LADARKIMELIGKIDKEKGTTDIEKILINFLSFLNENGYINDYDFVYETQIKKFIKQIKTNI
jgi:ribosomal protein S8